MKKKPPDFVIQGIPRRMEEDPDTGWSRRVFYNGPTSLLKELLVHAGVLGAHKCPHPPHSHEHDELHIALAENFEFIVCDADSDIEKAKPIDFGSLFFTDSNIPHTFRNTASQPAPYLHFRWKNESMSYPEGTERLNFNYSPSIDKKIAGQPVERGVEIDEIYAGPTKYLAHLKAISVCLQGGGRIPYHRHPHEVIFIFISGSVEILGKKVDAPGFAFLGTQVPHYIINHGPDPAHLYAIELHHEARHDD